MAERKLKRPRDPNQLAKSIIDIASGDAENGAGGNVKNCEGQDPRAVARSQRGSVKGGKARASSLAPERRAEIARRAAAKRWGRTD